MMMWRAAFCAICLAASAAAEDRALIIGIEGYPALDLRLAPQSAKDDAIAMAELAVTRWGFDQTQVSLLLDSAATSEAVLNALIDELVGLTAPGDRVLLYFAGVGSRNAAGKRVILAYDSDSLLGRIPEDALSDILDLIADRAVTVIVDAGFSGEIGTPGQRGIGAPGFEATPFAANGDRRAVYAAGRASQTAWETARGGILTQALLDAARDPQATHGTLIAAATEASRSWCDAAPACASQGLRPDFAGPINAGPLSRALPTAPAPNPSALATLPNPAGLSITIDSGGALTIGQSATFRIRAGRSGSFALWDLSPDGSLARVFPSALAPGDSLTPGTALVIPAPVSASGSPLRMRVTGPAGDGRLIGLFLPHADPRLATLDLRAAPATLPADIAGAMAPLAPDWSALVIPYTINEP